MIALIIDKSLPYVDFQKDLVIEQWAVSDVEVVKNFGAIGEHTIFGDAPTAVVYLNDIDSVKKMVEFINTVKIPDERFKSGVILCCTVARNSTKKLEALMSQLHGEIIVAKENSKDKTNIGVKMLSSLHLNQACKNFLLAYVGDEYDALIPIIKTISKTSAKQQAKISIEDLVIRLPQDPGSIPPWEIEKPILLGDADETIQLYRRIIKHSHYLVVLSILKNKFVASWRIAALLSMNPRLSASSVAEQLGIANNYPFKLSYDNAKKIGVVNLQKIVVILATLEAQVKGGSSADGNNLVELSLMKIVNILRK